MITLSKKRLTQLILETARESDWEVDEILKKCILPYLDQETLQTIYEKHFNMDDDDNG